MSVNNLHQLIKSLSPTEKGYIKKQAGVHVIGEQNKYIKIFDAIDKQEEYNEKEILQKFKNEPILNNFSVAKNYLFNFILKSLESYHTTTKSELRSTLNHIDILYNKNLLFVAKKMLVKAKSIAQKHELYEFMEEIIDWEIILLVEEATPQNYLILVNKYFGELYDAMQKKKAIIDYKYLYQKMRAKSLYHGLARNDEDVIELQKIIKTEAQIDEVSATFNEKFYKNLMLANFLFVTNEQKKANELMEVNVKLMEKNPHMIALKPSIYLSILRNKAVNELSLMRYKPLFDTLKKMDDFTEKFGHKNRYFEILKENLKLFVYLPTGQFDDALEVAKNLDTLYKNLPQTKVFRKEKQLQQYAYAYIYIGLENYKLANQHINELLNNNDFDFRSDLFCFAHILSLIVHFEMGNTELLEYRTRSTYQLLLKRDKLHKFEQEIIAFLKNSKHKKKNSAGWREDFIQLKNSIEKITIDKIEKNALSLFDLISWLESKIENKSFMEIKQAKFNQLHALESSNAHMY
ncbi:MAG: hypothetical protein A3F72_20675 [Bacteroidetes bacterium RIFCSPLOWO2_12_FULL_35_15]|nr:MAG: hypothetical protein A3F72_20675 [Bacteroidetes bacterium RIFCSPLOWO2_12_FULL_35_15]